MMLRTKWTLGGCAVLSAALFWVSCATSPRGTSGLPRFQEAAAADVVLRHYRWDQIHLVQPEYREDGFMVALNRAKLGHALRQLQVRKGLAVVVLNLGYSEPDLRKLITQWQSVLFGQGFQRVVCLEAGAPDRIDGLVILDDKVQASVPAQTNAGS